MAAAAASTPLRGPPFIRGARPPLDIGPSSHPLLDRLDAGSNTPAPEAVRDRRINALGPDPCLEFFFQVLPGTPPQRVRDLLAAAWAHDPLTALKLVCNLRGVRGTGKCDKEGFYTAALWIHDHHPKTLACNIPALAEFGYLKDFPELLFRIVHGADVRKISRDKHLARSKEAPATAVAGHKRHMEASPTCQSSGGRHLSAGAGQKRHRVAQTTVNTETVASSTELVDVGMVAAEQMKQKLSELVDTETVVSSTQLVDVGMVAAEQMKQNLNKQQLTGKVKKRALLAVRALDLYYDDGEYRFLFDHIADLLRSDIEHKNLNQPNKIGLAAKWCPTPGLSFDRSTLLCEGIARRLFPRDSNTEYADLSEEDYSYRVLHCLRHQVLVPLRHLLELPEVYMSSNKWSELPYERVASVAMHCYEALFKKHDGPRFDRFLAKKKAGEVETLAKKKAGEVETQLPHKIAAMCTHGEVCEAELQWSVMKDALHKKGFLSKLTCCIAICDVSDSMEGMSMEVCTALSLLISQVSEEPWADKVITFSKNPKIRTIKGKTIQEKLNFIHGMGIDADSSTNFKAVYRAILGMANTSQLPEEKMVKTIFVFSNKDFDDASENPWLQDRRALVRNFQDAGYGNVVPQIVFWNLQGPRAMTSTQAGVMRLKGFSNSLLKIFLENGGVVHAKDEMYSAVSGKVYEKLLLFD